MTSLAWSVSDTAADYGCCAATRHHASIGSRLRTLGVRRQHWTRQSRPVCGWSSLTDAKRAVADVVAEGRSNQQVPNEMLLSRHTVDFDLRQIFRQLGIESRVLLTRAVLTGGTATLSRRIRAHAISEGRCSF